MLEELKFDLLKFNDRKQVITGIDTTKKFFIKIEVIHNPNKTNNIEEEYKILKFLNDKGSKTCPAVYEFGTVEMDKIYPMVVEKDILVESGVSTMKYIIQQYIPDTGSYKLADIMLTLLEQRKLGVYQGDIKPDNLRFDSENSVCYFIDYDQSIYLSEDKSLMDNFEFLKFCSTYDKEKYGIGNWMRHFPQFTKNDLVPLFRGRALDLESTTIFSTQNTTNTINGIYHSIDEKDIFINGSRTISHRANLLDQVEFSSNERVLDIGCNSGLLSMYLHDRGCNTTGVDNDPHIVIASKIISNILNKDINYFHLDLDDAEILDEYDTIMLFSVFHHTKNPPKNAKKIIDSCSRFFLETRLIERGKQPIEGKWTGTTSWNFDNLDQLVDYCENMFQGFKLKNNLGKADKNRFILEFTK